MTVAIHIHGAHSLLKGDYPVKLVRSVTSYPVQGHQFSKAFRKKMWDGRKHLFNKRTGSFPTGLVHTVRRVLEEQGTEVLVHDHRKEPTPTEAGFDLIGISYDYPYDYQLDACKKGG